MNLEFSTFGSAMDYATYRALTDQLVQDGMTSGPSQTESLIQYTKLNRSRMKRIEKTFALPDAVAQALQNADVREKWLVLTECWCGDAAQNVPVLHALARQLPGVELRFALRDENLALMDQYLTNGGRSIPKLIRMDESGRVLGTWGPRPAALQDLIFQWKEEGRTYAEYSEDVHRWYHENAGKDLVGEMLEQLGVPALAS